MLKENFYLLLILMKSRMKIVEKKKRKKNLLLAWLVVVTIAVLCILGHSSSKVQKQDTQAFTAYCRFCLCLYIAYHKLHFGHISTYSWCSRWSRMQCISFLISVNWPFNLHLLSWLPAGHTLLPDHRWGSPVGGWPTGTPSLPLWCHTHTNTHVSLLTKVIHTLGTQIWLKF